MQQYVDCIKYTNANDSLNLAGDWMFLEQSLRGSYTGPVPEVHDFIKAITTISAGGCGRCVVHINGGAVVVYPITHELNGIIYYRCSFARVAGKKTPDNGVLMGLGFR